MSTSTSAATQINSSIPIMMMTSTLPNTTANATTTNTNKMDTSFNMNSSTPVLAVTLNHSHADDFFSVENNSFFGQQHISSFNDLSEVSSVGGETDSIDELTNLETSSTLNFNSPSPRLSDSSMSLLSQLNQYGIIKQYNRLECISHRVLPMPCHFSKCKIMKRDPSGGCAVFIVRYRESLDDDHEFTKREIDLDAKDLFDAQNDYYDTTSGKVIINRFQQNTIQRKDLFEDLSTWMEHTNPLYEEDHIDACFLNPLFYEKQPLSPQQVLFYHTCHYDECHNSESSSGSIAASGSYSNNKSNNGEHSSSILNRNPYIKHLESVTPSEEWIEIVNPLSLYGVVRTEAADKAFGRVLKTKVSKLRSSSVIFTSNATPSSQKRKRQSSGSISSDTVHNAISVQTSHEWQQSLLNEEFIIHVSLETEYEEFCNPLFEHETHNVLLPDGFKHSDLVLFMNQMKAECPPTSNKLIYNRCNIYEKSENSDIRSRFNRILSIRHQRTASSSSSGNISSSSRGSKSDLFSESCRNDSFHRRFSEYSLEDRRDEDIVIHVEKQKLTVYGSQLFEYISKKAQLYFTPPDVHMFLNYLIDTQRRSCDGVNRDLTSNILLLNPVPYDPQRFIEFSPQNLYRYCDDDNPVFYNDQIINIIPQKKSNSILSEHELMSKLFHKGAVPKDTTYSTPFSEGSVIFIEFP
ncbi:hypothetical protein FDP41_011397 [Naegleria fowleri]|uniref:Uncharacterized protein n=1 Tax=Naegleria fowleri TaxID=5763 RepID=A0A6A5BYU8_NAEFO|nr:uncharacterized protein FDP41_011397 [Naegleria fowleri]KAF0982467.1 hypothetical protein FDP41_011397 [Naegleria fowleri]